MQILVGIILVEPVALLGLVPQLLNQLFLLVRWHDFLEFRAVQDSLSILGYFLLGLEMRTRGLQRADRTPGLSQKFAPYLNAFFPLFTVPLLLE